MSRTSKSTETESRLVFAEAGWGQGLLEKGWAEAERVRGFFLRW